LRKTGIKTVERDPRNIVEYTSVGILSARKKRLKSSEVPKYDTKTLDFNKPKNAEMK
jgi:hypothetical protein